jgi:galactokinase
VRVHGGGFGGTAQAFVPLDMMSGFKASAEAALGKGCCSVLTVRSAGGVRII